MSFCRLVHFFVSKDAASQWAVETDADVQVLSVADGYELGRMAFAELLETARTLKSLDVNLSATRKIQSSEGLPQKPTR